MRKSLSLIILVLVLLLAGMPVLADQTAQGQMVELKSGPFTGKTLKSASLERPLMVMIDNFRDARPQAGLEDASIVYEFLVEGGITRFMALFYEKFPGRVGPIRSTRPYFIETALAYDAVLLHVGSSAEGYEMLATQPIDHRDEITDQSLFWRDSSREAPHNVYTVKSLPNFLNAPQSNVALTAPFLFEKRRGELKGYLAEEVEIYYWGKYTVAYRYDEDKECYLRYMDGEVHETEKGKEILVKNVLVQFVETKVVDEEGHLEMKLQGKGKALLFIEGIGYPGYWEKEEGQTIFLSEDGEQWEVGPGQTWIQVVPTTVKVEYQ